MRTVSQYGLWRMWLLKLTGGPPETLEPYLIGVICCALASVQSYPIKSLRCPSVSLPSPREGRLTSAHNADPVYPLNHLSLSHLEIGLSVCSSLSPPHILFNGIVVLANGQLQHIFRLYMEVKQKDFTREGYWFGLCVGNSWCWKCIPLTFDWNGDCSHACLSLRRLQLIFSLL